MCASNFFHVDSNDQLSTPAHSSMVYSHQLPTPYLLQTLQTVIFLCCFPAVLLATDSNQFVTQKSSRMILSQSSFHRCMSLLGDLDGEVADAQTASRTILRTVYCPPHTSPTELAQVKQRIGSSSSRNAPSTSLAEFTIERTPRLKETHVYTRLQTQLYPNMHF
jgi:hypothetical protein